MRRVRTTRTDQSVREKEILQEVISSNGVIDEGEQVSPLVAFEEAGGEIGVPARIDAVDLDERRTSALHLTPSSSDAAGRVGRLFCLVCGSVKPHPSALELERNTCAECLD
jgi:hypothetical protein